MNREIEIARREKRMKFSTNVLYFERRTNMLYWAMMFLVIALVAAVLGFGGIAGSAAWIAKVLFVIFLVLFIVSLATRGFRRSTG